MFQSPSCSSKILVAFLGHDTVNRVVLSLVLKVRVLVRYRGPQLSSLSKNGVVKKCCSHHVASVHGVYTAWPLLSPSRRFLSGI